MPTISGLESETSRTSVMKETSAGLFLVINLRSTHSSFISRFDDFAVIESRVKSCCGDGEANVFILLLPFFSINAQNVVAIMAYLYSMWC